MRYARVDWDRDFREHPHDSDAARALRTGASASTVNKQRRARGIPVRRVRTKREPRPRPRLWHRQWSRAYNRDRGRCQSCGRSVSTDEAEVHHIVHRAHWEHVGLPGSMHALDNLITLCGPCHNGGPGSVHSYFNSRIAHGAPLESETFVAAVDDARAHAARVAETGHSDRDGRIAWMYEMGLSTRAIGKQIGVSYPTVLRRLHAMGIQVRDRNANSTPPRRDVERPAWLTDDILGQWSMEAICKKAGCSRGPVQRWRRESGVTGQIGGSPMRCKRHEVSAVPD